MKKICYNETKEGEIRVSYTKRVREYCGKHSKGLIDISVVRNTVFADIPYKTLLKIFNKVARTFESVKY